VFLRVHWFGHSMWKLEFEKVSFVIDPFSDIGYKMPEDLKADVVISSHSHFDHNNFALVKETKLTISNEGLYRHEGFEIEMIKVFHDEENGLKRGINHIIVIRADNFKLVHCGDLGHIPDQSIVKLIEHPNIFFVPVGGYYTISPLDAYKLCCMIEAKLIVPMHYKTNVFGNNLAKVEDFLSYFGKIIRLDSEELTFEKDSITLDNSVCVFSHKELIK